VYDHTTFMMPVPGGAHTAHWKERRWQCSGVGLFCACRWQDSLTVQSILEQRTATDPLLRSACVRGYLSCSYSRSSGWRDAPARTTLRTTIWRTATD